MVKVLVTGAGGKLGQAVVQALALGGHRVLALYRSKPGETVGVEWVAGGYSETRRFYPPSARL
jgi:uncharacterized protein YbjT (DUF2867 family)